MTFDVIDTLTGQLANTFGIAQNEEWAKHLFSYRIDGWALGEDGTLMLIDNCCRIAYPPEGRFKIKWGNGESITGAAVTLGEWEEPHG